MKPKPFRQFDVVVIGASYGSLSVLESILSLLPVDFPAPIVVLKHVAPDSPPLFARVLGRHSALPVRTAKEGEIPHAGVVYVAPPGPHLRLEKGRFEFSLAPRVRFSRPAADVLFASAASDFGDRALGIVLTGYLDDGAEGSTLLRRAGAVTIAQDPSTCVAPDMPRAAIRRGVDFVLEPQTIVQALVTLVTVPGVAAMFGVGPHRGGEASPVQFVGL